MRLPADCPYKLAPLNAFTPGAIGLWDCCRAYGWLLGHEEPVCGTMGREAEVYRFIWRSSFDGDAIVRIGRQHEMLTLRWRYDHWLRAPAADDAPAEATRS